MRSHVSRLFAAVVVLGLLLAAASGFAIPDNEDLQQQQQQDQLDLSRLPDRVLFRWWKLLTDDYYEDQNPSAGNKERLKRSLMNMRPNLSINDQIEVLRNRLMLEMNRRRTQYQIDENKKLLESIGKRRKRHVATDDVKPTKVSQSKVTDQKPLDAKETFGKIEK